MTDFYDTQKAAEETVVKIEERIGTLTTAKREQAVIFIKNVLDYALGEVYTRGYEKGFNAARNEYEQKVATLKQMIVGWE